MRRTRAEYEALKPLVLKAILEGASVRHAAKEFGVAPATVGQWTAKARTIVSITERREELGELMLRYVESTLRALQLQSEHFGSREFLDDPESTASAHGLAI